MTFFDTQLEQLDQAWRLRIPDPAKSAELITTATQTLSAHNEADSALLNPYRDLFEAREFALRGQFGNSLPIALRVVPQLEQTDKHIWLARCHSLIASAMNHIGNRSQSMEHHIAQIEHARHAQDRELESSAFHNMSWLHVEANEFEKAVANLEKAISLGRDHSNAFNRVIVHSNLASALCELGRYEEAQQHLDIAFSLTEPNEMIRNMPHHRQGKLLELLGDKAGALAQYQAAVRITEQYDNLYSKSNALMVHGRLLCELGQFSTGIEQLHEALEAAEKMESVQTQYQCHELLASCFELAGEYRAALEHTRHYQALKETAFNDRNEQRLQTLTTLHETEQARREAALLQKQNSVLEAQVERRTTELRSLANRLEQAYARESELNLLKSQIITTISHEFRTPLTVIHTATDLMVRHSKRMSEEKLASQGQRINDAVFDLTDLLKDIALADQASGPGIQAQRQATSFEQFTRRLSAEIEATFDPAPNITFSYENQPTSRQFDLDFFIVSKIVLNLITNAVKYSPRGAPILLTATLSEQLVITVLDHGIGIPAVDQAKIWDLFYRGSNVETRRGMGMGMYVAQHMAKAHDANLNVQSPMHAGGGGTRFSLTLPL